MQRAYKTKSLPGKRFDQALSFARVADRTSDSVKPSRQRRIGYNSTIPNRAYEIIFTDDAIPGADQIFQQIKDLRRSMRAIAAEIGERLRQTLGVERELPPSLKSLLKDCARPRTRLGQPPRRPVVQCRGLDPSLVVP